MIRCLCQLFRVSSFYAGLNALHSSLERIQDKLKEASDRVEKMGLTRNNEDAQVIAEIMAVIRGAVVDCQVSGKTQTWPVI